eukprot:scaffold14318_cov96-Isochrysis_galbana.AAC.2
MKAVRTAGLANCCATYTRSAALIPSDGCANAGLEKRVDAPPRRRATTAAGWQPSRGSGAWWAHAGARSATASTARSCASLFPRGISEAWCDHMKIQCRAPVKTPFHQSTTVSRY